MRLAHLARLASASALAQLIPMLAAPLLTRWYGAEALGLWALFGALAANLSTIACGRYEYALVLPKRAGEAGLVWQLCLWVCAGVVLACGAAAWLAQAWPQQPLGGLVYALPLAVGLGGLMQALTLWNNRHQAFGVIAQARVLQQAVATLAQLAASTGGALALVASQVLGLVAAPLFLWWRGTPLARGRWARWPALKRVGWRYRQFPLINSPHAFINALQESVVMACIAALADLATAGYYALMLRLVKAPASLVGGALSEILLGELARAYQAGEDLRPRLRRAIRWLALGSLLPVLLLAWLAPALFGWALGADWALAGEYARYLMPYIWLHFVVAPLTVAPMVTGRQAGALGFSVVGNLLYVAALALGLWWGADLRSGLAVVSLIMPLYFVAYLWWLVRGSGPRRTALES